MGSDVPNQPSLERHFSVRYWSQLWGFSEKTVRGWFTEESGLGILRQSNTGRRTKRDYTTLMISPTAAATVYKRRCTVARIDRARPEVM